MKKYRLYFTFFLSLLIHILPLTYFIIHQKNLGFKKGVGEHRIKATFKTLSEIPQESLKASIKSQPLPKEKTQRNAEIEKKMQKPKEKPPIPQEKSKETKVQKQNVESIPQKEQIENSLSLEQALQELEPSSQNTLENPQEQTPLIPIEQTLAFQFADTYTKKNISEIYGPEFGQLGREEQDFIINNLSYIGRITQSYLRYPANAGMLKQSGMNIVEFYLHPNGDISDLKIIKESGFILLDRNSIKTIEIAYKDYPHPKVKTLIRFYISYSLKPY